MLNRIKNYFNTPEPKAIVLMYHRICDLETDPWELAVSVSNFDSQIKMLTERFTVLQVDDLRAQLLNKRLDHQSIYITFDDAYFDNYINAKPVLEKYACPATFFIPTHYIGKQQQFWWDELEDIVLHSKQLPSTLFINFDNKTISFSLEAEPLTEEVKQKQRSWIWPQPAPTNRCDLYLKIWELLKPLPQTKISAIINDIKVWANYLPQHTTNNMPMNAEQLKELSENKLFSLGLHTQTHPALASHTKDIQNEEIKGCRNYMQTNKYPAISAIAYPYGSYNADTLSIAELNQIALGFTTKPEVITKYSSNLSLGRYQVKDCSGAKLEEDLIYWLKA